MPKQPTTQQHLLAENEDLRALLLEADETLRAIRSGEVDALVVSGVDGEQIFTLKGADYSYRLLVEDMNEGALTLSAEGEILYANKRFSDMLKTPLEKIIGSTIYAWITPDSQRILQSLLSKGNAEKRRELTLTSGDGESVQTYFSMSSQLTDDMPDLFCVVVTDLREQKRQQETLIAAEIRARELLETANQSHRELLNVIEKQRLTEAELDKHRHHLEMLVQERTGELAKAKDIAEAANQTKTNFLSSMSHELRTPLNAILGFAQLLESGTPQPTESQNKRLQQILKAGWYLLELINEILDLSVIESGKLVLQIEPVPLADVVRECQGMIQPQAAKRDIQVTFPPYYNTLFAVADRTRLKQVLVNLLSNAIKYNRKQGTVELTCQALSTARIRISIIDSGAGLSAEKKQQLFQPFNRLGQESSTEEGTGIGLVVAKQLVELMGGSIGVESTVGVGSEFWVELERAEAPSFVSKKIPSAHPKTNTPGDVTQFTLLYVEDNPANLLLVEEILAERPHITMLSARDGDEGIALARKHLPDVILMDVNLPGISGIDAMRVLHRDPATRHIPIIALSANAMLEDIEKGIDAGFFRYLTKPVKIHMFNAVLDESIKYIRLAVATAKNDGLIP